MSPLIIIAFHSFTQTPSSIAQVWQSAIREGFSGGAIVVSGSKTLFFEIKNSTTSPKLQLTRKTSIPICSVTKAMTAEIVLALVDEGKISLDGSARQYLSWLPSFTSHVTVRQLLTHTSGLRNMDGAIGTESDGVGTIYHSNDESLKNLKTRISIVLGSAVAAPAGSKYDYNNADYLVLQAIVEAVAQQSYEHELQARIFQKANMKQTHLATWGLPSDSFVDCFQSSKGHDTPLPRFNMAIYGGAAGVISTPEDIGQWIKFTLANPIGQKMISVGSQYGGFQGFGGYAIQTDAVSKALSSDRKEPVFERPGAVNAYSLQVSFLPERKIGVAVFSNRDGEHLGSIFDGKGLAHDMAVAASRLLAKTSK